jgi:protein-S-isoprenylcysteine O-methyltransferase Ste14
MKKMTIFGAGHKIVLTALPALALSLLIGIHFKEVFRFGHIPLSVLIGSGIGLIVAGLSINLFSASLMLRAFGEKRLLTTGPYRVSRNPMYASFIFLTFPGLSILLNCWIVLLTSVALHVAVSLFVKDEEIWLAEQFKEEWKNYAGRVGRIFPKILQ